MLFEKTKRLGKYALNASVRRKCEQIKICRYNGIINGN